MYVCTYHLQPSSRMDHGSQIFSSLPHPPPAKTKGLSTFSSPIDKQATTRLSYSQMPQNTTPNSRKIGVWHPKVQSLLHSGAGFGTAPRPPHSGTVTVAHAVQKERKNEIVLNGMHILFYTRDVFTVLAFSAAAAGKYYPQHEQTIFPRSRCSRRACPHRVQSTGR